MNLFSSSPQDMLDSSRNPYETFQNDWEPPFLEKTSEKERRRRANARVALFLLCTFALVASWWLS